MLLAAAVPPAHVLAQAPPNDTGRVESGAPLVEALFLMPTAPGLLVFLLDRNAAPAFPPLAYWSEPIRAHVAGGPAFADSSGETWAYSAGVELLVRGIYAEVRNEHFRLPQHIEYWTARLGYLFHPVPEIAGGLTVGYRDAKGVQDHEGVEVGFPYFMGGRHWWLRYEAAYVMSRTASWSYRMEGEYVVRGGPLYIGLNVEAKTLPLRIGSKVLSVPVSVVVGVRR